MCACECACVVRVCCVAAVGANEQHGQDSTER